MEQRIKVLWFDDEFQKLEPFKIEARGEGIDLVGFDNAKDGINELNRNYSSYDAVLMDANFLMNSESAKGSIDLQALMKAKEALDNLSHKKKFEVFILTGQIDLQQSNSVFKTLFPKYYKKQSDEDVQQLFSDLRRSAINGEDTQIRHKFQRVFDVCTEKYIGERAGRDLLDILKNQYSMENKKYLNTIRNIIEDVFKAFHKFELLPLEFISGNDLNPTCKFLIGTAENGYQLNDDSRLPKIIGHNLWSLLNHSQPGSHRSYIDEHISSLGTTFLFNAMTYQLMDVLIWFKDYVDKEPKKKNWKKGVSNSRRKEQGFVKYVDKKGRGLIIINETREEIKLSPGQVNDFKLKARDRVEVHTSEFIVNISNVLQNRIKVNKI